MRIKTVLSALLLYGVIFVVSLLLSFAFFFTVMYKLYSFKIVNSTCEMALSILLSILTSVLITVICGMDLKSKKQNKFLFSIKNNVAKLLLAYVIINIIAVSIRNTILWDKQEIEQVLSIEWTIFGLSITVFLVWNVIIVEYLKKKQPIRNDKIDLKQNYSLLLDKQSFYHETQNTFSTVVILTINLFFLVLASCSLYILKKPESLFTQNLVICAFYFSTNSLP